MPKVIIVNRKDLVIGTEDKDIARRKGFIVRIARVFLFNEKGELFLQRRGPNMKTYPNAWDQSVGGHVDEGETYREAAKREFYEELGIKNVRLTRILKFYAESKYKRVNIRQFNVLYTAKYNNEKITLQKKEIIEGQWFSPNEIDQMIRKNPREFANGFSITWEKYKEYLH